MINIYETDPSEKCMELLKQLSDKDRIHLNDDLQKALGLDSLLMVVLLIDIEDTFGIKLDESDMNPMELHTVRDVIELVSKYCSGWNGYGC